MTQLKFLKVNIVWLCREVSTLGLKMTMNKLGRNLKFLIRK